MTLDLGYTNKEPFDFSKPLLTVVELADELGVSSYEIVKICMEHGIFVRLLQRLDEETVDFIKEEFKK
jgi:hypothetical protein